MNCKIMVFIDFKPTIYLKIVVLEKATNELQFLTNKQV